MFDSRNAGLEGRVEYAGPRIVVSAPTRESRRRNGKWTQVRWNSVMPDNNDLIEVRMACGKIDQGRAGDFLWVMAAGAPGKIVAFRLLP